MKKAVVDLSFLKVTKAQYIRAYGVAGSASNIIVIEAQPKTTVKYDSKTQKFIDSKTKSELQSSDLLSLEYRTLYSSSWGKVNGSTYVTNKLADFDVSMATVAGTTLVIRKAADASTPAGTEVKVKIAAAAKAPKVKIDYVKGTITLPKGAEAAVLGNAVLTDDSYTTVTGKVEAAKLLEKLGVATANVDGTVKAGYTLVVRTAARSAIVTIAAQPAKFSVKFTSENTVADSFTGRGFDTTKIAASAYQYRSLYASTWQDMKDLTAEKKRISLYGIHTHSLRYPLFLEFIKYHCPSDIRYLIRTNYNILLSGSFSGIAAFPASGIASRSCIPDEVAGIGHP